MLESLFDNIGSRLKAIAQVYFVIVSAICLLVGFLVIVAGMTRGDVGVGLMGAVMMCVGSLCAWISACFLYGFGELIENSAILADERTKTEEGSEE